MKNILSLCFTFLFIALSSTSFAEAIPAGTYQYLFSDGKQSFYGNKDLTIHIDKDNQRYFAEGDFDITRSGKQYKRVKDQFTFVFPVAGIFETKLGGPIYFVPSNSLHKQMVEMANTGTAFNTPQGTFKKQSDGSVTFTPKIKLPPLIVKEGETNYERIDPQSLSGNPSTVDNGQSLPITDEP
jgi:hypothetical protein